MFITEKDYEGFVGGKEKSFESIFFQYYRTLVSFSVRMGLVVAEAEDVALEVLHHVWEIRQDVKSPAALHSLLFLAVRNKSWNLLRDEKNRQRILREHVNPGEEEDFYDHVMDEEMCRLLDEAISKLPSRSHRVVTLLLEGKSVDEIAGLLKISVPSVKTYKARAIDNLRKSLKDYPVALFLLLSRL